MMSEPTRAIVPYSAIDDVDKQNKPFKWGKTKMRAANLLAAGEYPNYRIAAILGIQYATLLSWLHYAEFREKVAEFQQGYMEALLQSGIASKTRRIQALNDRWERLKQIIVERSEDPNLSHVPGGKTGLINMKLKVIGGGKNAEVIEEYEVDTGLLKEMREHEMQAAKELNQHAPQAIDLTSGGEPIIFTIPMSDNDKPIIAGEVDGETIIDQHSGQPPRDGPFFEWGADDDDEDEDEE